MVVVGREGRWGGGGEKEHCSMVVVSQYISDEPPLSKVANGPDSKLQGER